jgi:large subunit ribosomal protein L23
MALISRKKKEVTPKAPASVATSSTHTHAHILLRPRVTEKATDRAMNHNVYVFEVLKSATKSEVKHAVMEMYKVQPTKIAMTKIPGKSVFVRGKKGERSSGKKAYVYVKKGDKIEIV